MDGAPRLHGFRDALVVEKVAAVQVLDLAARGAILAAAIGFINIKGAA